MGITGNKRRKSTAFNSSLDDELRQPLKQLRLDENRLEPILQPPAEQNIDNERHPEQDNKDVKARLKEFVVLADNNKLRDDVWKNEAIDHFLRFSSLKDDRDYSFAGQCLSAVVKLYLLRVDLLYEDVNRFSADFRRRDNKRSRKNDGDDNQPPDPATGLQRQPRRQRVKKTATIASPESLNAKLETIPAVDPFFSKLNAEIIDLKANRMLSNVITSTNSSLKLSGNQKFWDCEDQIDASSLNEAREQLVLVKIPLAEPRSFKSKVIRSTLAEHRLTEKCLEEPFPSYYVDLGDSDDEMEDCDNCEVAMSVGSGDNAAIDEITTDAFPFYHEFETGVGNGKIQSTPACIAAIDSGYQTQPKATRKLSLDSRARGCPTDGDSEDEFGPLKVIIEDLEPLDSQQFDYSYRPMDTIINFYAGPSHWKFQPKPRAKRVRSAPRMKKVFEKVTLASLLNIDFGRLTIHRDNELAKVDKWSRGAQRLPQDFHLQPDILQRFDYSALNFDDPKVDLALEDEEYMQEDLQDDFQHFTENFDDFDRTMASEPTQTFKKPLNTTSFLFKRNRPTNMKLLKDTSMIVIENEASLSQCGETQPAVNFSAVYPKVDKLVSEERVNSSCALTFLSLLHAAAENKVDLEQEDNINDFLITLKPLRNDEE